MTKPATTPAPRRTRQQLAQADVEKYAGKHTALTARVAKLRSDLAAAEAALDLNVRRLDHAKTSPDLGDPAQMTLPTEGGAE